MPESLRLLIHAVIGFGICLSLSHCAAPRSGIWSPAVTPKGKMVVGGHVPMNLSTTTAEALYGGLEKGIQKLVSEDTAAITASDMNDLIQALYAYSIDPLGSGFDLQLRYGFGAGFDAGYAYATGAHALSVSWQFLGLKADSTWQGNVSLQYAWQNFELPSFLYLDQLQNMLRYEFKRRDLLLPLAFGKLLGAKGQYGSLAFGPAFNYTWVEYGSDFTRVLEILDDGNTRPFANLNGNLAYASYGAFANARLGYKVVYAVLGLSAFYQNTGTIILFNEEKTEFRGMTFIPSLGVEFRF